MGYVTESVASCAVGWEQEFNLAKLLAFTLKLPVPLAQQQIWASGIRRGTQLYKTHLQGKFKSLHILLLVFR